VGVVVNPGGTNERFAKANFTQATIEEHPDNRTIYDEIPFGSSKLVYTIGRQRRRTVRTTADQRATICPKTACSLLP